MEDNEFLSPEVAGMLLIVLVIGTEEVLKDIGGMLVWLGRLCAAILVAYMAFKIIQEQSQ